jgi:hypothetical protein
VACAVNHLYCELQAKEDKERQKKEDAAQHMRNRQRAMDAMYGSTSYSRQAALEASIACEPSFTFLLCSALQWLLYGVYRFLEKETN